MVVIRAKTLGYCYGARRAVDMAVDAAKNNPSKKVFTYGQLIHNPDAVRLLAQAGVAVLDSSCPQNCGGSILIIRAHGVSPSVSQKLKTEGYVLLDATCDRIQLSQHYAMQFSAQGYRVIIAGEKNHDEIIGVAGFAQNSVIIEDRVEAQQFADSLQAAAAKKTALIGQTTMSAEEYHAIAQLLTAAIPDIIVCDTICPITFQRQQALRELCARVDGVLVVGGKNSANTRQLLTVAQAHCKIACLVEAPSEIPAHFFELARVGITAGASTPDEAIAAVETALTSCSRHSSTKQN